MRYASNLVFLLLSLVSACSADDTIETIFDPCSPLVVVPGPGARPYEVQSIRDAIGEWEQILPTRIEVGSSPVGSDELSIRFESGDTYYRAVYFDKRGEILISREKLAPEDLKLAIAHELGHAFGLFHVPDEERASVMNVGNLGITPTSEDAIAVKALWASCDD